MLRPGKFRKKKCYIRKKGIMSHEKDTNCKSPEAAES